MNRNIALDILKISMAFMVVGLHGKFLIDFTQLGFYLTVNGIFRIAVPVFLIINGYYFYHALANSNQRHWLKRVLVLYVFWMMFYAYFWLPGPVFSAEGLARILQRIVIGYFHLWYISGMIGAAILLLLLRRLSSTMLCISILVTFIGGVLIQYSGNYHLLENRTMDALFNQNWAHRNAVLFSFPFFCMGYLINKHSLHEKLSFNTVLLLSVAGLLALFAESYANFQASSKEGGFDNMVSLGFVSPFVFMLFMKSDISGNSKNIALYSSGVYFIHALFLSGFRRFTDLGETSVTLLVILCSLFASYFIIQANKKLKFIL